MLVGAGGLLWVQPVLAEPQVKLSPEQTEGPFFVDEHLRRRDIRTDPKGGAISPGLPLVLALTVYGLRNKRPVPLSGAQVDVWHCDAQGVYSDVEKAEGHKFLRGNQITDARGTVEFATVYPGWYEGRTVHIHFKVRHSAGKKNYDFTSQLYFDDSITDRVHRAKAYARPGQRVRNGQDGIFEVGGKQLMVGLTPTAAGYRGVFQVGLHLG